MVTQSELERLQDRGLIQIPLLVAVLTKAKEKEMSWRFNCCGETFFPKDEKFTSDVARRMVETGQGTINKNNAMIEFEWATRDDFTAAGSRAITYQSIEKPSRYSTAGVQKRNKRITLRSGDEVMDKSSGKRFPVVIDQPPRAVSRDDIGYIVNGNRYNFQQFINKFAKPMYDIEETEIMEKTNDISTGNFNVISIEAIQ